MLLNVTKWDKRKLIKVTNFTIIKVLKLYILFSTKTMLRFILIQTNLNYTQKNFISLTSSITK